MRRFAVKRNKAKYPHVIRRNEAIILDHFDAIDSRNEVDGNKYSWNKNVSLIEGYFGNAIQSGSSISKTYNIKETPFSSYSWNDEFSIDFFFRSGNMDYDPKGLNMYLYFIGPQTALKLHYSIYPEYFGYNGVRNKCTLTLNDMATGTNDSCEFRGFPSGEWLYFTFQKYYDKSTNSCTYMTRFNNNGRIIGASNLRNTISFETFMIQGGGLNLQIDELCIMKGRRWDSSNITPIRPSSPYIIKD